MRGRGLCKTANGGKKEDVIDVKEKAGYRDNG
jgi:hypothetical protein